MLTKTIITISTLLALGLAFYFTAPSLKAQESQLPFDAQTIATDISKKVGNFEFSADPQCSLITARLDKVYETMLCQITNYTPSKAQELIDTVMANYQIEAANEWTKNGNYLTRIYVSTNLEEAPTINLVISDKIILLGY